MFDWLIGHAQHHWTAEREFFRYFAGMSLRGLVWTAPSGYALYHMGYGWQFSLSGALMGSVYATAWHLPTTEGIQSGAPWAECIWGYWIWLVTLTSALAGLFEKLQKHSPHRRNNTLNACLSSYLLRRSFAIAFEVWHALVSLIFIASTIYYSLVQQSDIRNKGQTFFGMFMSTVLLLGMQVVVVTASWLSVKWNINVTNEMYAVAVLTGNVSSQRQQTMHALNASGRYGPRALSQGNVRYTPSAPYQSGGLPTQSELDETQPTVGGRDLFEPRLMDTTMAKGGHDLQSPDESSDDEDTFDFPLSILKDHFRYALWHYVDACSYWRVFAAVRLFLGCVSMLACAATIYTTLVDFVWNIDNPRLLDVCRCLL